MRQMAFRLAIVGAGRGGESILRVLQDDGNIDVVAVSDANPDAPGLKLAKAVGIPVCHDLSELPEADIVINVTGSARVSAELRSHFSDGAEIVEGRSAYFFYDQLSKRKGEKERVEALLGAFKHLNSLGRMLNASASLDQMLELVLKEAIQVTGSPAGTISIYDAESRSLTLGCSIGFSADFDQQQPWVLRSGGVTERIFRERKPFVVNDTAATEGFNLSDMAAREGVKALVAAPLMLESEIVGILYVNDFEGRDYNENQLLMLDLMANEAAHAIQKARLFMAVKQEKAELKSLNEHLESRVLDRTRELTRTNEELVRASRAKSQFLSNMSHELRTPLTSINGFSEFLLDGFVGELNDAQSKYLKNINVAGKHLLELINGILDLSKIEAGKMALKLEMVDIHRLLEEVLLVLEGYATKANVQLKLSCPDDIPELLIDRTKFKQILYNLCSNAIKFSPDGGEVAIGIGYDNASLINGQDADGYHTLCTSVHDQGIGIPEEAQASIFNPFEQVDGSHSRSYEGTGLGLTLTKRLVEMHGGNISVESAPGEGSTFTFILPIEDAEQLAQEPAITEARRAAIASSDDKPLSINTDSPQILIVDDDPHTLEIITLYLTNAGYRVCHAMNGEEALDAARKKRPFLILLDVMMPGKDGWEVLQELKIDPETSDIPVVMCTVSENEELGIALGATDYLTKPFDRESIISKLASLSKGIHKRRRTTHILAIDDDEKIRELYEATLPTEGYKVHTAANGPDGLKLAEQVEPDIILLDLMMPGMDGFEVAERLKQQPRTREIPIIVVSAKELTMNERIRLMGHIEECVSKDGFSPKRLLEEIHQFETIYPQQAGLKDPVSGLLNHRYFQIRLTQELSRSERNSQSMACVLFDLDHFSRFCESAGTAYMHAALRKIGNFFIGNLRGSDTATRHRVDEFALLLPQCELDMAIMVVSRLKNMIEAYPFPGEEALGEHGLTACAAITMFPEDGGSPDTLLARAQELLKTAREHGGNKLAYRQLGEVIIK